MFLVCCMCFAENCDSRWFTVVSRCVHCGFIKFSWYAAFQFVIHDHSRCFTVFSLWFHCVFTVCSFSVCAVFTICDSRSFTVFSRCFHGVFTVFSRCFHGMQFFSFVRFSQFVIHGHSRCFTVCSQFVHE